MYTGCAFTPSYSLTWYSSSNSLSKTNFPIFGLLITGTCTSFRPTVLTSTTKYTTHTVQTWTYRDAFRGIVTTTLQLTKKRQNILIMIMVERRCIQPQYPTHFKITRLLKLNFLIIRCLKFKIGCKSVAGCTSANTFTSTIWLEIISMGLSKEASFLGTITTTKFVLWTVWMGLRWGRRGMKTTLYPTKTA